MWFPIILFNTRTLRINCLVIGFICAQKETRTLKEITPTASETATFTNFATWAGEPDGTGICILVPRTRFELVHPFRRHPLKVVRLPISPPGPFEIRKFFR
jgi:hypothetical protein